jgi:Short C-terminal domain
MLLSGLMRSRAIYGTTDTWGAQLYGRQGGRWARQLVDQAMPVAPGHPDPTRALRELGDLRQRGIITDAEFNELRSRLGV